jgi:hypothetical protein
VDVGTSTRMTAVALALTLAVAAPVQALADEGGGSGGRICSLLQAIAQADPAAVNGSAALAAALGQCLGGGTGGEGGDGGGQAATTCAAILAVLQADPALAAQLGQLTACQGAGAGGDGSGSFQDLGGYGWAAAAIQQLTQRGVFQGEDHGRFDPQGQLTRAAFAALVARLFGLKPPATPVAFVDVQPGSWAYAGAAAAAPYMAVFPTPGGTAFEPDLPVVRVEVAATIGQLEVAAGAAQLPTPSQAQAVWSGFSDGALVPPGIAQAAAAAVRLGLMQGLPDGSFGVENPMNRAQAAVLLWRVLLAGERMGATTTTCPTVTGSVYGTVYGTVYCRSGS